MKKGVYYPASSLAPTPELDKLVNAGYLRRIDGSFLCGPDSEPSYCLTDEGLQAKHKVTT
jgi:hypothetical protein